MDSGKLWFDRNFFVGHLGIRGLRLWDGFGRQLKVRWRTDQRCFIGGRVFSWYGVWDSHGSEDQESVFKVSGERELDVSFTG